MTNRKTQGFSLVELLAAVAIVGVISAIAYPSYLDQVQGSRRTECAAALTSLANAMERHYTVNGSYLGAADGGANTGEPGVYTDQCPVDGGDPTYTLTIEAATASTRAAGSRRRRSTSATARSGRCSVRSSRWPA